MYVNGIQCDTCTKILNVNMAVFSHGDLPQDWISTKVGSGDLMHFCSLHCLHGWIEKKLPVVEEVKTTKDNELTAAEVYWRCL